MVSFTGNMPGNATFRTQDRTAKSPFPLDVSRPGVFATRAGQNQKVHQNQLRRHASSGHHLVAHVLLFILRIESALRLTGFFEGSISLRRTTDET